MTGHHFFSKSQQIFSVSEANPNKLSGDPSTNIIVSELMSNMLLMSNWIFNRMLTIFRQEYETSYACLNHE